MLFEQVRPMLITGIELKAAVTDEDCGPQIAKNDRLERRAFGCGGDG